METSMLPSGKPSALPMPCTALKALIRPPVVIKPFSEGSGSTAARIFSRNWSTVHDGCRERIKAITPATCGVAMLVPSYTS